MFEVNFRAPLANVDVLAVTTVVTAARTEDLDVISVTKLDGISEIVSGALSVRAHSPGDDGCIMTEDNDACTVEGWVSAADSGTIVLEIETGTGVVDTSVECTLVSAPASVVWIDAPYFVVTSVLGATEDMILQCAER